MILRYLGICLLFVSFCPASQQDSVDRQHLLQAVHSDVKNIKRKRTEPRCHTFLPEELENRKPVKYIKEIGCVDQPSELSGFSMPQARQQMKSIKYLLSDDAIKNPIYAIDKDCLGVRDARVQEMIHVMRNNRILGSLSKLSYPYQAELQANVNNLMLDMVCLAKVINQEVYKDDIFRFFKLEVHAFLQQILDNVTDDSLYQFHCQLRQLGVLNKENRFQLIRMLAHNVSDEDLDAFIMTLSYEGYQTRVNSELVVYKLVQKFRNNKKKIEDHMHSWNISGLPDSESILIHICSAFRKKTVRYLEPILLEYAEQSQAYTAHDYQAEDKIEIRKLFNNLFSIERSIICDDNFSQEDCQKCYHQLYTTFASMKSALSPRALLYAQGSLSNIARCLADYPA